MMDVLQPALDHPAAPTPSPPPPPPPNETVEPMSTPPLRARDEVFWTELEIRRLGNLVAECIHARRYIGETRSADEERKLMRNYIEAMKRKSMRVLHRAELYAKSGYAAWPGMDGSITDPVSLAEEYVRVVENYEGVLREEVTRVKEVREENGGDLGDGVDGVGTVEEWEMEDDVAYKEALKREVEMTRNAEEARKELLEGEGMRRRKKGEGEESGPASYSKEDEELMARHQPIQDELTSNLVELVGQLKESIVENKGKLEREKGIVDQTEEAVENNLSGVKKQRAKLNRFSKANSMSWWVILIAAIVIVVLFLAVFVLLKIPV